MDTPGGRGAFSEKEAARLWREEAPRASLVTQDGRRLRVLYPGRPSGGIGPDFRDALLLWDDGRLLRGDVEVHLLPGDWRSHRHHRDPRYRGVVLHAVLWPSEEGEGPVVAQAPLPLVPLYPLLGREGGGVKPRLPLLSSSLPLGRALDRAGEAWFRGKVRAFAQRLNAGPWAPEEVLYQGLMEALGYSQNRGPFIALAQGLPLSFLRRALLGVDSLERSWGLWALLAGGAGLLEEAPSALHRCWADWGPAPVVPEGAWALARCRPANHPLRRLAGMALLLDRSWEEGLLGGLVARVAKGSVGEVREALVVPAPAQGALEVRGPRHLIGPGRAGVMAVNILLPFCAAWAQGRGDISLARRALLLFRSWPRLEGNELLREALAQLPAFAQEALTSARRQQGLLHLYRRALAQAARSPLSP